MKVRFSVTVAAELHKGAGRFVKSPRSVGYAEELISSRQIIEGVLTSLGCRREPDGSWTVARELLEEKIRVEFTVGQVEATYHLANAIAQLPGMESHAVLARRLLIKLRNGRRFW